MKTVHSTFIASLFGAVALLGTVPARAADDAADGKQLYQACATCHGTAGEGNARLGAPALAGQLAGYIARQLQHFRSGVRTAAPDDAQAAQMVAMAATLPNEAAIDQVAVYLAGLPPPTVANPPAGDLRNGRNQYNGACGACHGAQGEGNKALNAPRLAGQDPAYLARQFRLFKDRKRGAHPGDKYGRQMAMMANTLANDKDLADVIAFLASPPADGK